MSWATARAGLVSLLNGAAITSPHTETLTVLEYPPPGEVGPEQLPLAYIVPSARTVNWLPGARKTVISPRVVVYLGPAVSPDIADLSERAEAWVEKLATLFDGAQALNGTAAVVEQVEFSDLAVHLSFDERPIAWGFTFEPRIHVSESKTLGH